MRSLLVLIALALASTAHADAPTPSDEDHRGFLMNAALSGGSIGANGSRGIVVGAEAAIGWGVTPWLALFSRASVAAVFDREGFQELQLGARTWPLRDVPWLSIDVRAGRLAYSEEYDCQPLGNDCWGGEAHGYSVGGAMRAAVVRGRHGSFDVFLEREELRWRDATDDVRNGAAITRLGIGFSIHAAVY